ncbi:MAG TPA: O-antigen ligase family protein, partial [Gemmataceae bacterium]|nr:O-antigen ligase family protein [Gemmataceae bacterium]
MDAAENRRAELMRRGLLAMVTALLVARPLVLGEDPGLQYSLSSVSGLIVSMLWLVTAVAWAAWRARFGQGTGIFGWVEAGLATVVALVFLSSLAGAHYKHPAILIACEWLIVFLVLLLVRQLARRPEDLRGLMAVMVASAASLSPDALYQAAIDLPRTRALASDPDKLRAELVKINKVLAAEDPELEYWKNRLGQNNVYATYAHPNAFAGYLALLLPVALGWALAALRGRTQTWRITGAFACAALPAICLWLTHSRGAILGTLLAVGAALAFYWRHVWWPRRAWVLAGVAGVGLAMFAAARTETGAYLLARATRSFGLRTEYWSATLGIIRDYAWLGVGAGNFGQIYPRYMSASAYEQIKDPHNFVLELAASNGVLAMLALLATLGIFFWKVGGAWFMANGKGNEPDNPAFTAASSPPSNRRLDLFVGGIAGILLGFLFRAADLSAEQLPLETALSCLRSVIWFAAFGLL